MAATPTRPLARFRAELYQTFGLRRDALFELGDAVLTGDGPTSLVRRSLAPAFRRRWPSAPDALADGSLDVAALRRLCVRSLPPPPPDRRPLWAVDGSTWPRPAAKTSPERTYERCLNRGTPQSGIVPGWEYQWLLDVPEPAGSWVRPLDVARRAPTAGTPTALAIGQVRAAMALRPAGAARPVVTFDSHYDVVALIEADLGVDLLVRLPSHRVLRRRPGPYRGRGRRPIHGPAFRCQEPASHGAPDRTQALDDPDHGRVVIDAWERLHDRAAAEAEFAVVRVQVARLPRRAAAPAPLWLAWHGAALPADLGALWRWYERRFAAEHAFRFLKQDLGWTAVRPRHPAAADRWSWLLAAALWQLWLAREEVADARLPWEQERPAAQRSPGRVRRGFGGLLLGVGSPARAPVPRGNAPGRRMGERPRPPPRCPVVRRPVPVAP
jgi:hypothetical protein